MKIKTNIPTGTQIEHDDDGWWAYYTPGWKSASDPVGALHQDREDTRKRLLAAASAALACECKDCVTA